MNILFNDKTKSELLNLINNESNKYIRVKVAAIGCGKPAYDLYCDYKSDEDFIVKVNDVEFVISKKDERLCNDIEIKYDNEAYNNNFYVRSLY